MMKILQTITLAVLFVLAIASPASAKDTGGNSLAGLRLGFAYDRGFGVIASLKEFNFFVGNDGMSADYLFKKETLKMDLKGPADWYVGGGVFVDWDDDFGVRLPVGAEWHFAKQLDVFAELLPYLRVNNDAKFGLHAGIGIRYQF